jgi:hypothetical protein
MIMEDEKQIIEVAKALGLGELAPEIYHDMLQPAVHQIGDGLATIAKAVKISLAPLEAGIWGYEQIREWLSIRVTRIMADRKTKKIETPPLSIAGPLIAQLFFSKNEPDLKELYASLLASTMDSSNTVAHPSFVSIIQQLTSDEAKILRHIASLQGKQQSIDEHLWCKEAGVTSIDKWESYMDNLIRLRIFKQEMEAGIKFDPYAGEHWSEYMRIELTQFGHHFLEACIEKIRTIKE